MEGYDNIDFRRLVNSADLVVPDGKPLVWAQKVLGARNAQQVRGMDLMLGLCEHAARIGTPVGFYGGTQDILDKLKQKLLNRFKNLNIVCAISPPFRRLTQEEDAGYVSEMNASGVKVLFVGIGCPKQELWMSKHRNQLNCVMLGVGAAFDFISGRKRHAPVWMQSVGLEWLFRLISEPRRLAGRYFKHNPRFIFYFFVQLFLKRKC
jgi:N-acetylglucosaminyldiphosphoundecaprenol N-acetyl-beta-D-mannosaminyltransferase